MTCAIFEDTDMRINIIYFDGEGKRSLSRKLMQTWEEMNTGLSSYEATALITHPPFSVCLCV